MHARARKKPLRAPFVITLAAAAGAALGACGGQVSGSSDPTATSNPPVVNPDGGDCPAAVPAEKGACVTSTKCGYGDCMGSPTTYATCEHGAWQISMSSCNPPSPYGPCPQTEPTMGTGCNVSPSAVCPYHENECDEQHGYQSPRWYACVGSTWQSAPGHGGSCNPPAPTCPAATPQDGAPCYGDLKCPYGDCYGTPTTEAACSANVWHVLTSTCNPPPQDAGGG